MPTYAYRCTECATAFDVQQSFEDDALTECPTCGGRLRKVFGSIGVTFSGSGFYRTDSRAPSASASGGSSDAGGASSGSSSSGASTGASAPASSPAPAAAAPAAG